MFKKIIISTIIITALHFTLTASDNQPVQCNVTETQECWEFDSQKGWIYQALTVTVTPTKSTDSWSYDEEKGWIYQADEITVIG